MTATPRDGAPPAVAREPLAPGARPFATTRFAPAPTGHLHLGHVANALWVWGAARAFGARVLLRLEDHDRVRCRPEFERSIVDDLSWLGFEPDGGLVRQSERGALYAAALERLAARGLVYPCDCTRREIAAGAPADARELRYSGRCAARGLDPAATPIRRVRLEQAGISFDDLRLGGQLQIPAEQCGDLLAIDRDGNWTYQFAVVVDDLEQGVDLVVRGVDLLESTGRQLQLAALLGRAEPPRFLHHPLVLRPDGTKLSKSNRDTGIGELRRAGWSVARALGAAGAAIGLVAPGESAEREALVDRLAARIERLPGATISSGP